MKITLILCKFEKIDEACFFAFMDIKGCIESLFEPRNSHQPYKWQEIAPWGSNLCNIKEESGEIDVVVSKLI